MAPTVTVDIEGNSSGLRRELKTADSSVMDFGRGLKSLAGQLGIAFGVGAILSFTKTTLSAADAVVTYAKGIGETVRNVTAIVKAGQEGGIDQERTLGWLQKIKDAQGKMITEGPSGTLARQLKLAEVNIKAFADSSPAEAFDMITRAAEKSANGVSLLNLIMGKAAASDAIDAAAIMNAAGGWEKYAKGVEKAAAATERLAKASDAYDKTKAAAKEGYASFLDWVGYTGARIGQQFVAQPVSYLMDAWKNKRFQNVNDFSNSFWEGYLGYGTFAGPTKPKPPAGPTVSELMDEVAKEQADAAKAKLYEGYKSSAEMKAAAGEFAGMDTETLKAKQAGLRLGIEKDRAWLTVESLTKQIALEKIITAEVERREKAEDQNAKRRADIISGNADKRAQIADARQKAIQGISVDVMTPNALQRIGGFLGGRGGYEFSVAERQEKLAQIQVDYLKSIEQNSKDTAKALRETS